MRVTWPGTATLRSRQSSTSSSRWRFANILNVVDAEVKSGTAQPISEDLPTLIRTLAGTTALMLTGDPLLVGRDNDREDLERRVRVLEQLWLNALWGGPVR